MTEWAYIAQAFQKEVRATRLVTAYFTPSRGRSDEAGEGGCDACLTPAQRRLQHVAKAERHCEPNRKKLALDRTQRCHRQLSARRRALKEERAALIFRIALLHNTLPARESQSPPRIPRMNWTIGILMRSHKSVRLSPAGRASIYIATGFRGVLCAGYGRLPQHQRWR